MSDRVRVLATRIVLALVASGACFGGAFGQGQRKETTAKKAIRDVDPSLLPVVTPGTSFTYRVSLKKGYKFDVGNGDGITITKTRGNVVVGASRRVSATVFEQDFSSAANGVAGSATLQINVTNAQGRLKFVRAAVTIALPGGNELVTINGTDKTITTRIGVGARPTGVDTAATGTENFKTAFVANTGSNTVTAVDLPTNTVVATIPVGGLPSFVAVGGVLGAQTVYVTNSAGNSVTAIDAQSFNVIATIPVGKNPQGLALVGQPAVNEALYVANHDDDTVSIVDVLSNTVVQTISVGDGPLGVAVTGRIGLQTVAVTEENASVLTLLDANTNGVIANVPVGTRPVAVAAGGPVQNIFYVANQGSDSISFVDINTNTQVSRVLVGAQPNGVTVASASGLEEIYVSNGGDGTVSVVDAARARLSTTVPVGGRPRGVATIGPISLPSILVTN
jgi:YVTN family beta-propeller protein